MKKKSFLVGALLAHSMFTFADAKFSVADLTIAAGEQRTVAVNVELTDKTELSAFEMDIQLPAGLTFKGFDEVMTTTDYGWVLSRSKITDGKYKFVGYAKPGAKLTPESASNILAFNFDVVASSSFNPKTAGDIEILNPLATDLDKPAPQYAIDGKIITENGDVNGIYRLKGMVNVVTINDGQTEVQFDLTPKHVQTITVELTNPKIEDDPSTPEDESLLGGDPNIRGLQGVIHLPKGLKIKGLGTLAYRTVNEDLTLGVPQEVKDDNGNVIGTDVSFVLWANTAPLRESNIYGSPIFSFDVEGEGVDEYNSRESVITIDNIVASKFKDSNRYTLDDEITVTVDNPNQVAKEDVWDDAVKDYRDQLAEIIADIEKDHSNVDQYIGITDAEAAAAAAIDAYEAAIKEQYEAGVLHEKKAADFQAESDAADKLLFETIPDQVKEAIALAADNNKLAQDAIDGKNPAIPEVPANIAKDDTPATDGEPGTIEKAKNEWTAAMQALKEAQEKAAEDGKQADADIYKAEIEAMQAAVDGIQKAIDEVQKKAEANNKAAEDSKKEFALPANVAADDTPAEGEELGTYNKALKALDDAVAKAAEEGTQAKDGIYTDAIQALKEAQEAVIAKGEANNALLDAAVEAANEFAESVAADEKNGWVSAQEAVAEAQNEFDKATEALEAAKTAAEEAGTQAKDDIYKEEIDRVEAATEALQSALAAAADVATANLAEANAELEADTEKGERYDEIKNSNNIPALEQALADAKQELQDAIDQVKADGKLGDTPNPLAEAIEKAKTAREAVDKAIADATIIANEIDDIIGTGMDDLYKEDIIGGEGELGKAKVVDPSTVEQIEGRLPTTSLDYLALLLKLGSLVYGDNGMQNQVEVQKGNFLAGDMSLDELRKYIDETLPQKELEVIANAEAIITDYLKTVQRGDVGGDGRWTTNDYALLRKVILSEEYPAADGADSKERYAFARYDINQDGTINVGDAQAALNYTFYGSMYGPNAESRGMSNVAEQMTATMNGNVIAVALNNSRQYSALQLDVVLSEGMTVTGAKVAGRTAGYSVATGELKNGATRVLLTANEAGQAFEGNDGAVLYIEVEGMGNVDFQNIYVADVNAATTQFNLNSVAGGATAIEGVDAAAQGQEVYSLGGRMLNALKKGVNIIRRADGSTQKVIKK